MGGPSEREYRAKLNKIREKLNKRAKNVRKDFEKIEKMKVEALKKTERARREHAYFYPEDNQQRSSQYQKVRNQGFRKNHLALVWSDTRAREKVVGKMFKDFFCGLSFQPLILLLLFQ
jgi:5-formaminoimidazole-4-carboxamide-1-beta-D-ribofuranosyl 5'-monophosphate synthetase